MNEGRLAAAFVALALAAGAARAEAPDWSGTYAYTEDGGRTAGGAPIVITHEIAVTRAGGRYKAEIIANGYQTSRHVLASADVSGAKLALRFERDGEGQMFKDQFKPGALLLELERGGGRRILTHWGAYTPAARERFRNPGVYFKRR